MRGFQYLLLFVPAVISQKAATIEVPDGPRGGGALFKTCGGFLGIGANDLCYDVTPTKMLLGVGSDTTTDDVLARICADDNKTCCETPALRSAQGGDWKVNSVDTWEKKHFGLCIDKVFKIKRGLNVTLIKKGEDTVQINSLFIEAQTVNKDGVKENERFECGTYNLGGKGSAGTNSSYQSQFCKTSPYTYERVKAINVTIGNAGTNDNVKVDICSNVNDVCCQNKLSGTLSDDWSKNDVEIWKEGDMRDCKVMQYKVSDIGGPVFTLKKDGKNDLIVNKILLDTESLDGDKYQYDCGDFKLESQGVACKPGISCQKTTTCKRIKKNGAPLPPPLATTTPSSSSLLSTTRRSDRIATSTPTTTRPPFRSGSG